MHDPQEAVVYGEGPESRMFISSKAFTYLNCALSQHNNNNNNNELSE